LILVPYAASNAAPAMDGTAAAGTAAQFTRGDHVHPTDTSRAPLASPALTGTPTAPTVTPGTDSSTKIATTAFVQSAIGTISTGVTSATGASGIVVSPTTGAIVVSISPSADVAWNSHKITGLLDPSNAQDAATKNYVDATAQGLDAKQSVKAASTANLTLSAPQTVDGVSLIAGDRILVKDQTTQANNGIYVVASGAWTRATDANTWTELVSAFTFVEQGTVNADNGFVCTVDQGGTLGTTAVTWVQFSGAGQIIAGNGLTKSGNTISAVGTANRISVGAGIDIDAAYAGQTSITTLGTIATGTWNATTIGVAKGGTGATTLTGYVKGSGTSPFTAVASIPNTDISGLGTMSTQNASAVAITGGSVDGVVFDMGSF
jgi:hypothetical protein